MKLFDEEHDRLMEEFERLKIYGRMDKEDRSLWPRKIIYQDGRINELFLVYRAGYSYGKCIGRMEDDDQEVTR